jgi:hypothetical protein
MSSRCSGVRRCSRQCTASVHSCGQESRCSRAGYGLSWSCWPPARATRSGDVGEHRRGVGRCDGAADPPASATPAYRFFPGLREASRQRGPASPRTWTGHRAPRDPARRSRPVPVPRAGRAAAAPPGLPSRGSPTLWSSRPTPCALGATELLAPATQRPCGERSRRWVTAPMSIPTTGGSVRLTLRGAVDPRCLQRRGSHPAPAGPATPGRPRKG